MNRNDSSHSFRENYQEYILLQQKTAVLVDEYHDRKLYSDTKAAEGRRCLEHTKQLLNEMAEFVPLEGAVETVRDSISDIDKHNTDQNPYSSTIMELRKLDAKYDFDSLLDSDTPVSNSLLRSVQQHGRIMQAMPRKPSSSNGAAPNQTSWSVAPSFCDISNAPVVDVTKINSFADREAGTHARKHYHASTANLSEVRDSLNWVSFLIQREQFYTRSTRREMAAKAKAQEQQNREKGTQQDGLNTDADDNLLSHHLHKEDGGREEEGGDERDREGMENEDGGVEGEMKSPIPEAQRVLQEALGEISQDELLRNLYRQHLKLQLPNPQRTADRVDEAEHVANLSSVIVDHFMRSVSHAVAENRAQEASVFEVTVQRAAVLRLQCLFRRSRARKQLQALRTQKR